MCVDVTTLCWVGLGREVAYYGRYMCSVGWGNDHSISRLPSPADQTPDLSGDSHRHPPAGVRVSKTSQLLTISVHPFWLSASSGETSGGRQIRCGQYD